MSTRGVFAGAGSPPSGPAYRYWRIYITAINGDANYAAFAEIEIRGTVGGADLTTASTPTSQSSYYTFYQATQTRDNSTGTFWLSDTNAHINSWCRYDLTTASTVAQVAIYPYVGVLTWAPKDFVIQGSDDGTTFTDVKSFTGVTDWSYAWKTFDL